MGGLGTGATGEPIVKPTKPKKKTSQWIVTVDLELWAAKGQKSAASSSIAGCCKLAAHSESIFSSRMRFAYDLKT